MASAEGINKLLVAKRETTWGVKATASGARYYRRVTGQFNLQKEAYASNEIRPSQQMSDMRHGTRSAVGSINGELSGSAYDEFIAAGLRKDFVAGATTGSVTTIAVDATGKTFTRSSGSFVSDGFGVGSVILCSGFASAQNNGLFVVLSMTATVLTTAALAGQTYATAAAGATVTILEKGKKTYTPLTAHTNDSFTVEEWHPDATVSRTFLGMQVDTLSFGLNPNGMATIDVGFMGKDEEASTSSAYFTSPTAVGGQSIYSAPDGFLFINGVASDKMTSLAIDVSNGITQEGVIGSNAVGAKSRGKVAVTASGSAIFDSSAFLGYFNAETEVSLIFVMMSADDTNAFAIHIPRFKIGSASTDDGEKNVIVSFDGSALEYVGSAVGVQATTMKVQDTTLS